MFKKLSKKQKKQLLKILGISLVLVFVFIKGNPTSKDIESIVSGNPEDIVSGVISSFNNETNNTESNYQDEYFVYSQTDIPAWDGKSAYIVLNKNEPNFTDNEKQSLVPFEHYSELDNLGRCGIAFANICKELMPTEERGNISSVYPSGWKYEGKSNNNEYDTSLVDGGRIYNRCHLIGFQLAGENANKKNLITGTRYLNIEGMLPFENMIDDYVDETNNHVLFRVTPVYDGDNLVPNGVQMEAWSVEDDGEGICFNVYAFNIQPGIEINYTTGQNWLK